MTFLYNIPLSPKLKLKYLHDYLSILSIVLIDATTVCCEYVFMFIALAFKRVSGAVCVC